jgi:hypothetical protein
VETVAARSGKAPDVSALAGKDYLKELRALAGVPPFLNFQIFNVYKLFEIF